MVAATRAAAEHATERRLEHAGVPVAFDASALDVDVGALKRIFAEHFADNTRPGQGLPPLLLFDVLLALLRGVANGGSQLPRRTFWAQFLTPPPSQVLRALRPLIEKVGLESDLETLFERDGETGVDLLLEEGGAAPKLSPHHDHLERPGVAATLLFTLQAGAVPMLTGFIPFGGQGSSLAPPGSGHRACIGQHAAGSALIFRRLVNGIYQHYVEGAAPKVLKQVGGLLRARGEAVMPRDVVALWLPDAGAAADPDIGRSGSFAAGCDAPAMAEREHRLMLPLAERLKAEGTATYERLRARPCQP
ncbi:hypothetical protein EMIHUDRAFT_458953 [Emiliania huxleyi CCMP1516]|uniref:Fe2OG dioxygenase domain-containing protein n=2 Tax=Emiliania huxleyi TaxID=2903 RepID=A0A0D3J260_EMIH1|nr:hypothetical protein EMIHUDRAFT_458953 [Emiliania huxleyi CCMP1516]EOD17595.1 hypothetical protein EMIHUDRAFT_458953 [Emiliania huxleyi CCMP1516]|eukprot:XP_005770024.1 hypothetical protein EMIHUDRAFT_458953 [Emiliania huxleyi CCMP1516]